MKSVYQETKRLLMEGSNSFQITAFGIYMNNLFKGGFIDRIIEAASISKDKVDFILNFEQIKRLINDTLTIIDQPVTRSILNLLNDGDIMQQQRLKTNKVNQVESFNIYMNTLFDTKAITKLITLVSNSDNSEECIRNFEQIRKLFEELVALSKYRPSAEDMGKAIKDNLSIIKKQLGGQ